jgi:uncharacterized protein
VTRLALARPRTTLVAVALLTLLLGIPAAQISFDNTPETWLPTTGSGLADYQRFRERFGEDSLVVAFTDRAEPASSAWRAEFESLVAELRAMPGLASVEVSPAAVAPAERDALASPLTPYLLSADRKHAAIAMGVDPALDATAHSELLGRIEARIQKSAPRVGPLRLAGVDVITRDLDAGSKQSLIRLAPLVLVLMCLAFGIATRSAPAVAAMLLTVVVCSVWSIGLLELAGRTLNLVVVVMPAILAVVTTAQATHLLSRLFTLEDSAATVWDRPARADAWRAAGAATWRPCLLSAVTTVAGFASVGTSQIPPVRDLGVFTAIGVLLSFVLSFTLLPVLLVHAPRVRPRPVETHLWTAQRAARLGDFLRRHSLAVLGIAACIAAVSGVGMRQLKIESHILRFFPPNHRVPVNYAEIEEYLVGLTPIELVLDGERDAVLSGRTLDALDRFVGRALAEEPLLRQAISITNTPRTAGLGGSTRAALLRGHLPKAGEPLASPLAQYLWLAGGHVALRTTLTSRTASSHDCQALVERLRGALAGAFPPGVTGTITGGATRMIYGQVLLLDTQLRSFALALLMVTLVIALAFRSVTVVWVSLLPNLLPIAVALGAMGLLGIPLDTATVTVAGIALGLIVDDTIHLLHDFCRARNAGATAPAAVASTLLRVGRPVLVTSLAVALGFGAFAFSPFRPTRYFGVLIAGTSLVAVLCDLIMLPALLQLRARGAVRSRGATPPAAQM